MRHSRRGAQRLHEHGRQVRFGIRIFAAEQRVRPPTPRSPTEVNSRDFERISRFFGVGSQPGSDLLAVNPTLSEEGVRAAIAFAAASAQGDLPLVETLIPWPSPRRDNAARDSRSLAVAGPCADHAGTRPDPRDAAHRRLQRRSANRRTGDRFPFCPSRRTQSAGRLQAESDERHSRTRWPRGNL